MPADLQSGWDGLARSQVDLDAGELGLTLSSGESVLVDLGWPGEGDLPPADRSIVYLDQNHWVALAQSTHAPDRLNASVRHAAAELIALAESREVLLPFSSGHLVETVPRGKQRRDVALKMLALSRGLQMRNPLDVRRQELAAAITGREPRCPAVFTLEPDVLFTEAPEVPSPSDFPPIWKQLHRRMTTATATIAVMLEDDEDPSEGPGPAARQRWLDGYRTFAGQVHAQKLGRDETRSIAHAVLAADLRDETIQAAKSVGASDADLATWLTDRAETDFERAPHLATLEDLLYHRLRSRDDHWKPNDLIDMHFLSCAAGYADLIVAERKFSDYLRRSRRRYPRNAAVATTLPDAVEALS